MESESPKKNTTTWHAKKKGYSGAVVGWNLQTTPRPQFDETPELVVWKLELETTPPEILGNSLVSGWKLDLQ